MKRDHWGQFLILMAVSAVVFYSVEHYPQYVWPWGVAGVSVVLLALGIWTIIDYRTKHRRPPTL